MRIKLIIFDMDGVLIDFKPVYIKALKAALKKYGFEVSRKKIVRALGAEATEVISKLISSKNKSLIKKIKDDFDRTIIKKENLRKAEMLPYAKQTLKNLSKKFNLILLTNADRKFVNIFLRKFRLNKYFRRVIVGEDRFKTKDQAIRFLMKNFGVSKKEIVYVGDMVRDIKIARNVGCKIISIPGWDNWKKLKKHKPDYLVKNTKTINKILS